MLSDQGEKERKKCYTWFYQNRLDHQCQLLQVHLFSLEVLEWILLIDNIHDRKTAYVNSGNDQPYSQAFRVHH